MSTFIPIRKQRVDLLGNGMGTFKMQSMNERIEYSPEIPYSVVRQDCRNMLIPLHFADTLEIIISCGVQGTLTLGSRTVEVSPNSIVFILPHVIHGGLLFSHDNGFLYNLKFSFEHMNRFVNILRALFRQPIHSPQTSLYTNCSPGPNSIFRSLSR